MQVFITGTDTNVGKTLVSSWLCLHTHHEYFKPIQTGGSEGTDSEIVSQLAGTPIHKEIYLYKQPVSPHLAAKYENNIIDISYIKLPESPNLIVEGAGGVLVPINRDFLMIDIIKQLNIPVIIVARSSIGTINHTLLSLEALHRREIPILGVIVNGVINKDNSEAIEFYGNTRILATIDRLQEVSRDSLQHMPLSKQLKGVFGVDK